MSRINICAYDNGGPLDCLGQGAGLVKRATMGVLHIATSSRRINLLE